MENFLQRAFLGRPLDKVLKFMAILDVVAGILTIAANAAFIGFKYDDVAEELDHVALELKDMANEHEIKEIDRAHADVLAEAALTSSLVVIILCFDAACEFYLFAILWAASKDGNDSKLKRWWWIRLCLDLFMSSLGIGGVIAVGIEYGDIIFVVIAIYRVAELVVVHGFRKQMA